MANGKIKRLRLFNQLATDLASHVIGKRDVIWCPLCLEEFGRDALETDLLTEEHIIPQSAGGRESTLSCKTCNDKSGQGIDNHLARQIRMDNGLKGQKSARGTLRVNGVGAGVDFFRKASGDLEIRVVPTTPYVAVKLEEAARLHISGERPVRLKIVKTVDNLKFVASVAKAAYLGLFADRGYKYILVPSLDRVRKAINEDGADRRRLLDVIIRCQITNFGDLPEAPDRVTLETGSLGSVPVCLSLVNLKNASGAFWVVLPPGTSVNTGAWDGLKRATDAMRGKADVHLEIKSNGEITITGL